jgi:hypothetical protein
MSVVEEPDEPAVPVLDPDEAVVHARRLPPRDKLVLRDVPDDEWAAFEAALSEV